jgi:hypothetical protein
MNVTVSFDGQGWWTVTVNGMEVDAFKSRHDAQIFANYYKNKMSHTSADYNRGFNQ